MDVQKTGKFLVRNTARQLKIDDVARKKKKRRYGTVMRWNCLWTSIADMLTCLMTSLSYDQ